MNSGLSASDKRVDVYLPLGTAVDVKIGDVVKGGVTVLGHY